MIFERFEGISFDVERLRNYWADNVSTLEPVMQSPSFGGWSILSYTGSYKDGWQQGHRCYKKDASGQPYYDHALAAELGVRPSREHNNPTETCTGYVRDVIAAIKEKNLNPCRARWSILRGSSASSLHRDAPSDTYAVRLHIPIITNGTCVFCQGGKTEHIRADGSAYLVWVNNMHQIFNRSPNDRIHIIMNVFDETGVSQRHRIADLHVR